MGADEGRVRHVSLDEPPAGVVVARVVAQAGDCDLPGVEALGLPVIWLDATPSGRLSGAIRVAPLDLADAWRKAVTAADGRAVLLLDAGEDVRDLGVPPVEGIGWVDRIGPAAEVQGAVPRWVCRCTPEWSGTCRPRARAALDLPSTTLVSVSAATLHVWRARAEAVLDEDSVTDAARGEAWLQLAELHATEGAGALAASAAERAFMSVSDGATRRAAGVLLASYQIASGALDAAQHTLVRLQGVQADHVDVVITHARLAMARAVAQRGGWRRPLREARTWVEALAPEAMQRDGAPVWMRALVLGELALMLERPQQAKDYFSDVLVQVPEQPNAAVGAFESRLELQPAVWSLATLHRLPASDWPDAWVLAADAAERLGSLQHAVSLLAEAGVRAEQRGWLAPHRARLFEALRITLASAEAGQHVAPHLLGTQQGAKSGPAPSDNRPQPTPVGLAPGPPWVVWGHRVAQSAPPVRRVVLIDGQDACARRRMIERRSRAGHVGVAPPADWLTSVVQAWNALPSREGSAAVATCAWAMALLAAPAGAELVLCDAPGAWAHREVLRRIFPRCEVVEASREISTA